MASMITITGNLGADAERRKAGEHDLAELRVAVTTGWGDRKVTTWWHVEQWGKPAEWIGELRKGAAVTVIGEAYMREWTSKDGKAGTTPTIKAVEVVAHERARGRVWWQAAAAAQAAEATLAAAGVAVATTTTGSRRDTRPKPQRCGRSVTRCPTRPPATGTDTTETRTRLPGRGSLSGRPRQRAQADARHGARHTSALRDAGAARV
jgi:single-stranded DNA-binding protein